MALFDNSGPALDPATAGLLSAAFAGLQASGPSLMPRSLGQVMGSAGQAGLGAYSNTLNTNRQLAQADALVSLEKAKQSMVEQQLAQDRARFALQQNLLNRFMPPAQGGPGGGQGGGGPTPAGMSPSTSSYLFGSPQFATPPAPQGSSQFPLSLQDVTALKLAGMPDLLPNYQASQPDVFVQDGIVRNRKGGDVIGTQPIITPNGMAILPTLGVDGKYSVSSVPGADALLRGQKRIESEESTAPVTLADGRVVPAFMAPKPGQKPMVAPSQAPNPSDPFSTMPTLPKPMGVGQSTYQKTIDEARAKFAGTLSEKYGSQAEQADQRISLNNQALELVDKADTGPLAASQAEVKSWLVKYAGIDEGDFANTPSATKALDKDLLNAATQKAKAQFGARITQQEVMLMLSRGAPNVDMPKAAIKYLIESDNAGLQYQKKQASDLGTYLSKGGDPHQFEAWYAKTFPMSGAVSQVHLNTGKRPPLSSFKQ